MAIKEFKLIAQTEVRNLTFKALTTPARTTQGPTPFAPTRPDEIKVGALLIQHEVIIDQHLQVIAGRRERHRRIGLVKHEIKHGGRHLPGGCCTRQRKALEPKIAALNPRRTGRG